MNIKNQNRTLYSNTTADKYVFCLQKGADNLDIQGCHLANALATTKFAIGSKDKSMTPERIASPEYQAVASRLDEVWADMSPEYKQKYSNLEGVTSIDGGGSWGTHQSHGVYNTDYKYIDM